MKFLLILLPLFFFAFFFISPAQTAAASFSLSPDSGSFRQESTFDVEIILDTNDASADGVSAVLIYNPLILEVQDANPDLEGVQITAGEILPMYLLNKVEEGKIRLDGVSAEFTNGDLTFQPFSGQGTFGTVKFKVLNAVQTEVRFDFTPGEGGDSDVYQSGNDNDLLTSATGAVFNSAGATTPTPTPTPPPGTTPTPTPTPPPGTTPTPTPTPPPGTTPTPTPTSPPGTTPTPTLPPGTTPTPTLPPGTTPTPTPTLAPWMTPTPTLPPGVTPTPTPVSRTSMPSTDGGVPEPGFLTPTIILTLLGLGLIFLGAGI